MHPVPDSVGAIASAGKSPVRRRSPKSPCIPWAGEIGTSPIVARPGPFPMHADADPLGIDAASSWLQGPGGLRSRGPGPTAGAGTSPVPIEQDAGVGRVPASATSNGADGPTPARPMPGEGHQSPSATADRAPRGSVPDPVPAIVGSVSNIGSAVSHASSRDEARAAAAEFERAARCVMPVLGRYARRLTGEATVAEDLVQDALLRAWSARESFRPGTNFRAWLLRIARNAFLSDIRRNRRQVAWDPDTHDRLMATVATQDDALYQADFQRALDKLPAMQAEAFLLITHDGMSYDEAAAWLGMERGTLGSYVSRARARLRAECLADTLQPDRPDRAGATGPSEDARSVYERWKASGSRTIG